MSLEITGQICLIWIVKRSRVLLKLYGISKIIGSHFIWKSRTKRSTHFWSHGWSDTSRKSTLYSTQILELQSLISWTLSKRWPLSLILHHHWHASLNDHALILLQGIAVTHQILWALIVVLRESAANLTAQASCMLCNVTRITTISLIQSIRTFSNMVGTFSNFQSIALPSIKHGLIIACCHCSLFFRSLRINSSLSLNQVKILFWAKWTRQIVHVRQ